MAIDSHFNETDEKKNYDNKKRNRSPWMYLPIALMGILAVGLTAPAASATTDITQLTQQILNIVKSTDYGNQAIMNAVKALQGSSATSSSITSLQSEVDAIKTKVDTLNSGGEFQIVNAYLSSDEHHRFICQSSSASVLYINVQGPASDTTVVDSFELIGGGQDYTMQINHAD